MNAKDDDDSAMTTNGATSNNSAEGVDIKQLNTSSALGSETGMTMEAKKLMTALSKQNELKLNDYEKEFLHHLLHKSGQVWSRLSSFSLIVLDMYLLTYAYLFLFTLVIWYWG